MKRVLIVDDNAGQRRMIEQILATHDITKTYHLSDAVNGEDAWGKFQAFAPDLVITDLSMWGEADGLDLIRKIRDAERGRRGKRSTILMVTGDSELVSPEEAQALGFEVLLKPYPIFSLLRKAIAVHSPMAAAQI